jgi:hypothetical protein
MGWLRESEADNWLINNANKLLINGKIIFCVFKIEMFLVWILFCRMHYLFVW